MTLTFDLILVREQVIMMDYCAKFGDFSFSHFGFIVRTDRITHTHTFTDTDDCYTHTTTVGMSRNNNNNTIQTMQT